MKLHKKNGIMTESCVCILCEALMKTGQKSDPVTRMRGKNDSDTKNSLDFMLRLV